MSDETPRSLTAAEQTQLRQTLTSILIKDSSASSSAEKEDANDLIDYALAMLTNGKSVDYITNDLKNMGMDHICDDAISEQVGKSIDSFLSMKSSSTEGSTIPVVAGEETPNDNADNISSSKKRMISLKSKTENALTMSGALGSNKASKKGNYSNNVLTMSGALGTSRESNKKQDSNNNKNSSKNLNQRLNDNDQKKRGNDRQSKQGGRGGGNQGNSNGGRRSLASEAFKKLAQQKDDDFNNHHRLNQGGRGRGGSGGRHRNNEGRGGGRGNNGGRNDMNMGPSRGRGDGGKGGRGNFGGFRNNQGQKRRYDDHNNNAGDIHNYTEDNSFQRNNGGDGGRGRGGGRGGYGQDFGRGRGRVGRDQQQQHFKRQRYDNEMNHHKSDGNYNDESNFDSNSNFHNQWYDNTSARGGRRGRGRGGMGRGRGARGAGQDYNHDTSGRGDVHESTQAAAEASPSPLVAAEFQTSGSTGTKLSYGGRGFGFRGGGRGYRGGGRGGRGFPGRSDVAAMLAAKTWSRSKANGDGSQTGAVQAESSSAVAADSNNVE